MINWKVVFKNGEIAEGESGGFTSTLNKKGGIHKVAKFSVEAYEQIAEIDMEERTFKVTSPHGEIEFLPFVEAGNEVEIVYYTKVNMLLDAGFQPTETLKIPRIGVKSPGRKNGIIIKLDPSGIYERIDEID